MKKLLLAGLIGLSFSTPSAFATDAKVADIKAVDTKIADALPAQQYTLKNVIPVAGRQGVATDGQYYYVSGSKALYKYSLDGELLYENEKPFKGYKIEANHIGDISYFNNELYISAEWFADGAGKNIQIAIYDPNTLKFKRSFEFNEASGQKEVSAIAIDRTNKSIWLTSWVGGESGRYLYEYDLETGKYKRKVHLQPVPQWIQGIIALNGELYLTADDGTADEKESDHLYRVLINNKNNQARVVLEHTFNEFKDVGEIEGLTINRKTNQMIVLANRGKQIVLGMPKGLYPGYDKEISELYIFDMKK